MTNSTLVLKGLDKGCGVRDMFTKFTCLSLHKTTVYKQLPFTLHLVIGVCQRNSFILEVFQVLHTMHLGHKNTCRELCTMLVQTTLIREMDDIWGISPVSPLNSLF